MDNIKVELKVERSYGNGNQITSDISSVKLNSPSKQDLLDVFLNILINSGAYTNYSSGDKVIIKSEDIQNRSN